MTNKKVVSAKRPKRKANKNKKPKQNNNNNVVAKAQLLRQVCSLTDPFCAHANGAKYPDDSSYPSLTMRVAYIKMLPTDASGNGAKLFLPRSGDYGQMASGDVTSYPTTTFSTWGTAPVAPPSGATHYRITAVGIRLTRITPPLTSSGMVRLRAFAASDGAPLGSIDVDTLKASKSLDVALQDCTQVGIVFMHTNQRPSAFYALRTNQNVIDESDTSGFGPITIAVSGGPASVDALQIEYIQHTEYLFNDSSDLALLATPAPVANPLVTNAAAAVSSLADYTFHRTVQAATSFITSAARRAVDALASRYVPLLLAA